MASIYRRRGLWRAQIRRHCHQPLSRTFQLKSHAELWARETERAIELGALSLPIEQRTDTLGDILARYLKEVSPAKRGFDAERYRIAKLLRHDLSQKQLSLVTSADISCFRDARLVEVSSGSVRKELQLLSHTIEIAIREWAYQLPSNPVRLVRMPPDVASRERRLEGSEEVRLLEAAGTSRNIWLKPFIVFAVETAMRRGEVLALNWSEINRTKSIAQITMSKNGRSRAVPLSSRALTLLSDLPQSLEGHVFPLSIDSLRSTWRVACKRAEIEDLRVHDLRHEATSRFFERGLSVMEVASITGHRDLRMLARYTHLKAEDLARKLC